MTTDLINTLEAPGEFDAMMNLRPGEPYFLLIGRDGLAPGLVIQWADASRRRALADYDQERIDDEQRKRELRKCTQAEMIASDMQAYKRGNPTVATEPTAESKPSYNGVVLPEETQRRDAFHSQRVRAAAALNNAAAEMAELREFHTGAQLDTLNEAIGIIEGFSRATQPKRPGIDA